MSNIDDYFKAPAGSTEPKNVLTDAEKRAIGYRAKTNPYLSLPKGATTEERRAAYQAKIKGAQYRG
jgi:hypothetical protein